MDWNNNESPCMAKLYTDKWMESVDSLYEKSLVQAIAASEPLAFMDPHGPKVIENIVHNEDSQHNLYLLSPFGISWTKHLKLSPAFTNVE